MPELNEEQLLVVAQKDLGTTQMLTHRGRMARYRLPSDIDGQVTLRFRGWGKTVGKETGDLLLRIAVDRGRDVRCAMWLSETYARTGGVKKVVCGECRYPVRVPAQSKQGQVLRLKSRGEISEFGKKQRTPARGDCLIALNIFPDQVKPHLHSAEAMSADDLSLESWIYRRIDEILAALRPSPFSAKPFTAVRVADLFNEMGWEAIGSALIWHLGLKQSQVRFETSSSLDKPGQCFTKVPTRNNQPCGIAEHTISIHKNFLDDPFAVTAILAHEFCHILEIKHFGRNRLANPTGQELIEMERTVDLLVFLFGLGEFQMRVARQSRITLGYFNQQLFERMHLIWCRKQKEFQCISPVADKKKLKTAKSPTFLQWIKGIIS